MTVLTHFWVHWPFQSPSAGPSSASKNVAPVWVLGTFASWARFALMIFFSFCYLSNFVKLVRFLMLFGMIFLDCFVKFAKMCSPPRQEARFRMPIFANLVSKAKFPCPIWFQNHHFGRGISVLCCSKNNSFRRLGGKWPSPNARIYPSHLPSKIFRLHFSFSDHFFFMLFLKMCSLRR